MENKKIKTILLLLLVAFVTGCIDNTKTLTQDINAAKFIDEVEGGMGGGYKIYKTTDVDAICYTAVRMGELSISCIKKDTEK